MKQFTHEAMRGPSEWSIGDRELMAAYVSKLNDCAFCVGAHSATAARAYQNEKAVAAVLVDLDTAPIDAHNGVRGFDRGMFTADVAGHPIRWAFMPPYLNTLNFSETELHERRGWRLTRDAVAAMQRTTTAFGGRFVVMFLPFKSQVYWPLLERALPRTTVDAALHFYLDGNQRRIDIAAMRRNRLAQNRMMRDLCERLQIPFLDTTAALQARLESGENVYFPDESHLNETGEAVVAETLAAFLSDHFFVASGRSSRLPHSSHAP